MIGEWLKAELHSSRFREGSLKALDMLGYNSDLLTSPNYENSEENKQRERVLHLTRGWPDEWLFMDFPSDVVWYEVDLAQPDIDNLLYLNHSYWRELSNGTRRVKDAAESIKRGKVVFGESNQAFFDVAKGIENGETYPAIIVVAPDEMTTPVILEGHLRTTAYSLADHKPPVIGAIMGINPKIKQWGMKDFS